MQQHHKKQNKKNVRSDCPISSFTYNPVTPLSVRRRRRGDDVGRRQRPEALALPGEALLHQRQSPHPHLLVLIPRTSDHQPAAIVLGKEAPPPRHDDDDARASVRGRLSHLGPVGFSALHAALVRPSPCRLLCVCVEYLRWMDLPSFFFVSETTRPLQRQGGGNFRIDRLFFWLSLALFQPRSTVFKFCYSIVFCCHCLFFDNTNNLMNFERLNLSKGLVCHFF